MNKLAATSHEILMAVLKTIQKQQKKTEDYYGKPCSFGVGVPTMIAKVRDQMTNELVQAIDSARIDAECAREEEQKQ